MKNLQIHSVTRAEALFFRLNSQNLAARLAPGSLLLAASVCGFQNTPPGAAELSQAARSWNLLAGELVEISLEGRKTWLLQRDLEQLVKPEQPAGTRFLPPYDPYLQLCDRETLIPQKS